MGKKNKKNAAAPGGATAGSKDQDEDLFPPAIKIEAASPKVELGLPGPGPKADDVDGPPPLHPVPKIDGPPAPVASPLQNLEQGPGPKEEPPKHAPPPHAPAPIHPVPSANDPPPAAPHAPAAAPAPQGTPEPSKSCKLRVLHALVLTTTPILNFSALPHPTHPTHPPNPHSAGWGFNLFGDAASPASPTAPHPPHVPGPEAQGGNVPPQVHKGSDSPGNHTSHAHHQPPTPQPHEDGNPLRCLFKWW